MGLDFYLQSDDEVLIQIWLQITQDILSLNEVKLEKQSELAKQTLAEIDFIPVATKTPYYKLLHDKLAN